MSLSTGRCAARWPSSLPLCCDRLPQRSQDQLGEARIGLVRDAAIQARIIGNNCSAALLFDDAQAAGEILALVIPVLNSETASVTAAAWLSIPSSSNRVVSISPIQAPKFCFLKSSNPVTLLMVNI